VIIAAQISETHFDGSQRNYDRAARAMRYLNGLPIDVVIASGDIADHGLPAEYDQAREAFASPHRVLAFPGNHDVRAAFRVGFLDSAASDAPINATYEVYGSARGLAPHGVGGVRFVLCDSVIPGAPEGLLADDTLRWLSDALGASDAPTIVGLHHPPVPLHIPFIDDLGMRAADALEAVIAPHPQVLAVLCGHAHTPAATTFAGKPLLVAPGVSSTLFLPWEPTGADPPVDYEAPPAVAFHVIEDDRVTTHFRVIP
jgi:3',5'-cyclic AMP phosphodiesterase CpdA